MIYISVKKRKKNDDDDSVSVAINTQRSPSRCRSFARSKIGPRRNYSDFTTLTMIPLPLFFPPMMLLARWRKKRRRRRKSYRMTDVPLFRDNKHILSNSSSRHYKAPPTEIERLSHLINALILRRHENFVHHARAGMPKPYFLAPRAVLLREIDARVIDRRGIVGVKHTFFPFSFSLFIVIIARAMTDVCVSPIFLIIRLIGFHYPEAYFFPWSVDKNQNIVVNNCFSI